MSAKVCDLKGYFMQALFLHSDPSNMMQESSAISKVPKFYWATPNMVISVHLTENVRNFCQTFCTFAGFCGSDSNVLIQSLKITPNYCIEFIIP